MFAIRNKKLLTNVEKAATGDKLFQNSELMSKEQYIQAWTEQLGTSAPLFSSNYLARRLMAMNVNPKAIVWKKYEDIFGAPNPLRCDQDGNLIEQLPLDRYDMIPMLDERINKYFPGVKAGSKSYVYTQAEARELLIALECGFNHMLTGPTGCGKTFGAEEFMRRLGLPVLTLACTADTVHSTLFGKTGLKDGSTFFKKGLATLAIEHYGVLILDEVTSIDPTRGFDMNPLLENRDIIIDGEGDLADMIIENHGMTHVIGTSNTGGKQSGNRAYKNARTQDLAWRDRWYYTECQYKPVEQEKQKIIKLMAFMGRDVSTFTTDQQDLVMKVVDDYLKLLDEWRTGFVEGTISTPISSRATEAFVKYWMTTGDMYAAYEHAILPRLESDDLVTFVNSINSEMPAFVWTKYDPANIAA